jgi:hypothetical protein
MCMDNMHRNRNTSKCNYEKDIFLGKRMHVRVVTVSNVWPLKAGRVCVEILPQKAKRTICQPFFLMLLKPSTQPLHLCVSMHLRHLRLPMVDSGLKFIQTVVLRLLGSEKNPPIPSAIR